MFFGVTFVAVCTCFAQTTSADRVKTDPKDLEKMLASGRPREIAWASYTIVRQNRRDLAPNLAALIASHQQLRPAGERGPVPAEDAAILAVADALIQLEAKLAAATVMHLYPQFPAQTIILLSRASDNVAPLLEIFRTTPSRDLWLASGNLLALHPPHEFVYSLLDGFTVTFVFHVFSGSDEKGIPEVHEGCAGDTYMVPDEAFRDWPRARMYRLVASTETPPNTFAPGIHPVGFRYWETTDYRSDSWADGNCSPEASKFWRTGLLAEVQGRDADDFPLEPKTEEIVRYSTPGAFENHVRDTIEEQSKVFEKVLQSFMRSGTLSTLDARALHLKCRIQVQDERPWPHSPLPALEGKWCTPARPETQGVGIPE